MELEKNEQLAELICIILGDGHLHVRGEKNYHYYGLAISLNRIDEKEYVKYVYNLMKRILKQVPKIHNRKDSKSVDLKINNKAVILALVKSGIKSGDKVKNQISVPNWIKNNKNYIISGLRGLFDTDGSVWINNRDKNLGLSFRSASRLLVEDFIYMCNKLGIKTGKVTESNTYHIRLKKRFKAFQTQIIAKGHIIKFLKEVKPKKWDFKKHKIEDDLQNLDSSIEDALRDRRRK